MENKLAKYVGLTIVGMLGVNIFCSMAILITDTPKNDELFLFVLFSGMSSLLLSYFIMKKIGVLK